MKQKKWKERYTFVRVIIYSKLFDRINNLK